MPELPEVETIKKVIEPQIQGLTITNAAVKRPEVVAYPSADTFCRMLTGRTISHMTRRGKFLVFMLDSNDRIILHLRMTGCLLLTPADFAAEKHTHIILSLNNGMELRFSDTRRFGRFWLLKEDETDIYSGINKLGAEPFDTALTAEYLSTHLGKRKKTIKECLLEQTTIAGIGNIYADEILFTAGIYPARPANNLEYDDWERLAKLIPERLAYFIEKNEITAEEYLQNKGRDYRNTPYLQVYGHAGKPCPVCKETLCRMVIGSRSSVYCPSCQKNLNMSDNAVPFWEKSYQEYDTITFSNKPNSTITEFEHLIGNPSKVLDVGCGEGQNAIYLARQGHHVDAFDLSEHGITKLKHICELSNVQINAFAADLTSYQFEQCYDMITCFGTLHFVAKNEWKKFINTAKEYTNIGGIHIIQIFTDTVPASEDIAPFAIGLAKDGELKELYADWEILQFKSYVFEDEHPNVPKHLHASNKIVARKVK